MKRKVMILTGKTKEDFELYLSQEYGKFETTTFQECASAPQYPIFLDEINLPEEIENALIIEFFDSIGIYVDVGVNQITDKNTNKSNCNFDVAIFHPHHRTDEGRTLTQLNINISRQEATKQAIIKTNEIYNTKFRLKQYE